LTSSLLQITTPFSNYLPQKKEKIVAVDTIKLKGNRNIQKQRKRENGNKYTGNKRLSNLLQVTSTKLIYLRLSRILLPETP
jgi:hypothetical protein